MLETLIFREIRYNTNNEQELEINKKRLSENSDDIEAMKNLASIYHALKKK